MSWADDFQGASEKGREKESKGFERYKRIQGDVGAFCKRLVEQSGLDPKRFVYVEMVGATGIPTPLPVHEATPSLSEGKFYPETGDAHFPVVVQMEIPDDTIQRLPIWIHLLFRVPTEDRPVRITFGGKTVEIPGEADAMLDHIREVIMRRLAEGPGIPPVHVH